MSRMGSAPSPPHLLNDVGRELEVALLQPHLPHVPLIHFACPPTVHLIFVEYHDIEQNPTDRNAARESQLAPL